MNKNLIMILVVLWAIGTTQIVFAGEHGGQEHGGTEIKTTAAKTPSNDDIRNAMKKYVTAQSEATGTFDIEDPETGKMLNMSLLKVHERVGKTGNYYYSCADFKDVNTNEMYDLDLDVADQGGTLSVVDVRIHKVNGEPRYTYDDHDNRIPLMDTKSHTKEVSPLKSIEGAVQEHGGKEHGGN